MSPLAVRIPACHAGNGETLKGAIFLVAIATLSAFVLAPAGAVDGIGDFVPVAVYDSNGELVYLQELEPSNPNLVKTTHFLRLGSSSDPAKPGGGGGVGTDCASTAYKLAGWHWTSAYSAKAGSYASTFSSAGNTWDSQTGFALFGGIQSGNDGTAGTQDFKNNIQFVNLGATTTIAVTTTWAYRTSGEAVESDGQYNTYYSWSTSGASGSMDVLNIATHEIGHTFGLDHPTSTSTNACLTMYAYANNGETAKRTLGDGDILGIRAIYGA